MCEKVSMARETKQGEGRVMGTSLPALRDAEDGEVEEKVPDVHLRNKGGSVTPKVVLLVKIGGLRPIHAVRPPRTVGRQKRPAWHVLPRRN